MSALMGEPLYRIQKAAELSGVSEELIRAWERRYSVVAPERTDAGYRLYSDEDVELLKRLRELTEQGTPISRAAQLVPDLRKDIALAQKYEEAKQADRSMLERWRGEILRGAEQRDQVQIDRALDEALSALPPLQIYDEVIIPALREVGDRWHAGTLDVAQEHLATQALRGRVMTLLHFAPRGGEGHVLIACFPEEQHEIGALGAALRLRHAGIRATLLGQRTPTSELGAVVRALRPIGVGLSAVTDPGPEQFEQTLRELSAALPRDLPVVVGGRAAMLHRELCERHGLTVFPEGDWERVISGIRARAAR